MILGVCRSAAASYRDDGRVVCRRPRPTRPSSEPRRAACPAGYDRAHLAYQSICSRKSSRGQLAGADLGCGLLGLLCIEPARPVRSNRHRPCPKMRLAIRSGGRRRESSSFSRWRRKDWNTGHFAHRLNAAPPRASPSSLVKGHTSEPGTPSAAAVVTVLTDHRVQDPNGTSSGLMASCTAWASALVDAQSSGVVDDDDVSAWPGPRPARPPPPPQPGHRGRDSGRRRPRGASFSTGTPARSPTTAAGGSPRPSRCRSKRPAVACVLVHAGGWRPIAGRVFPAGPAGRRAYDGRLGDGRKPARGFRHRGCLSVPRVDLDDLLASRVEGT